MMAKIPMVMPNKDKKERPVSIADSAPPERTYLCQRHRNKQGDRVIGQAVKCVQEIGAIQAARALHIAAFGEFMLLKVLDQRPRSRLPVDLFNGLTGRYRIAAQQESVVTHQADRCLKKG